MLHVVQKGEAFPTATRKINLLTQYLDNLHTSTVTPDSFPHLPPEPSASAQLILTTKRADHLDFLSLSPPSLFGVLQSSLWFHLQSMVENNQSSGCSGNGGGQNWLGRGLRELSGIMRIFYILTTDWITQSYAFVKNQKTFKFMHFTVCKFYIKREKLYTNVNS